MDYTPLTFAPYTVLHEWDTDGKLIYTGADITADSVYSYSSGRVIAVGKDTDLFSYSVTVQYDVFNILRYGNLSEIAVGAGDILQEGTLLGKADRFLHFEYATKEQGSSRWPVRVGDQTYWKHDPSELIL
ncbi:hypothetical protein [Ruminococcus sp.]|uniref:M23 family metallopeptidase n=1 Tax=Ruminococcus sp. TaxID=41978 RepID=UPI001B505606|nr:hypothetical protein [Ruminococcus sp.]MBP5433645.1 hypothetical protein [Ruminococcus sp.]